MNEQQMRTLAAINKRNEKTMYNQSVNQERKKYRMGWRRAERARGEGESGRGGEVERGGGAEHLMANTSNGKYRHWTECSAAADGSITTATL